MKSCIVRSNKLRDVSECGWETFKVTAGGSGRFGKCFLCFGFVPTSSFRWRGSRLRVTRDGSVFTGSPEAAYTKCPRAASYFHSVSVRIFCFCALTHASGRNVRVAGTGICHGCNHPCEA
ncbi:epimerase [Anopheles sinensis]|uniref:Epimerase n=1 Tax=Anopheles sinensis TaxID=74873 RepID=A0A084VX92_ANOSI|nr:epimerase [Anopheles sinensis]